MVIALKQVGGYRRAHSADFRGGLSFMTADDSTPSSFGHPSTVWQRVLTERMRITPVVCRYWNYLRL